MNQVFASETVMGEGLFRSAANGAISFWPKGLFSNRSFVQAAKKVRKAKMVRVRKVFDFKTYFVLKWGGYCQINTQCFSCTKF